jgi:hypothetical protein
MRLTNILKNGDPPRARAADGCCSVPDRCRFDQGAEVTTSMNLAACIDRGRERRVTLNCEAVVVEPDGCSTDVILIDMTQHGFRLRSRDELEVGAEILLQMPQVPAVRGIIHWMSGHEAGGVFLDPIVV